MAPTFFGCSAVEYTPVDLQIDVIGALPEAAETLDMCVAGAGVLSEGAGNGRVLFAGLPADIVTTVTLAFRAADGTVIGGVGPVELDADTPWLEAPQDRRTEPCTADGEPVASGDASWVLGVRFSDEPW